MWQVALMWEDTECILLGGKFHYACFLSKALSLSNVCCKSITQRSTEMVHYAWYESCCHFLFERSRGARRYFLSVDPGYRDPLRCGMYSFYGLLQSSNCLFNIIVHNSQIKEVTIGLPKKIWFLCETLQAPIILKCNTQNVSANHVIMQWSANWQSYLRGFCVLFLYLTRNIICFKDRLQSCSLGILLISCTIQ